MPRIRSGGDSPGSVSVKGITLAWCCVQARRPTWQCHRPLANGLFPNPDLALVPCSIRLECYMFCCGARQAWSRAYLQLIGTGSSPTEPMQLTKVKPS